MSGVPPPKSAPEDGAEHASKVQKSISKGGLKVNRSSMVEVTMFSMVQSSYSRSVMHDTSTTRCLVALHSNQDSNSFIVPLLWLRSCERAV